MTTVIGDGDLYYFKGGRWVSIEFEQVAATGGTESDITVGGVDYRLHTFTTSDDLVVTAPGIVEAFVVGGGGAGGRQDSGVPGGGGGAGGVLQVSVRVVPGTYPVTVGSGGIGSDGTIIPTGGGDSGFAGYFAIGGAVGGRWRGAREQAVNNRGGSGGGGAGNATAGPNGFGIAGQGNDGGDSLQGSGAGGGGGAGTVGENGGSTINDGGKGGDGIESDFNGTATYYGGGGGGNRGTPPGGLGGGGTFTGATSVSRGGTDGLGGGGAGASSATGTDVIGGNGGNGLVMLRYRI